MQIGRAAVVGAGAMGGSIAQLISYSGRAVILTDVTPAALDAGMARAMGNFADRVQRGKLTAAQAAAGLARITPQLDYQGFDSVDLVIEAVTEKLAVKQAVFRALDGLLPPHAILVSNTSALSISAIAAATGQPGQVIGLHFFNPPHVMKLVEVIPGQATTAATLESTVQFARALGKTPLVVRECPGFLVNRLLSPYLNEAIFALQEGAADVAAIDAAMVAAGQPLGPLRMADMIGLDVALHAGTTIAAAYSSRMQIAPLLSALVAAGRLGHKTGAGFYNYGDSAPGPSVADLIRTVQATTGLAGTRFTPDRLLLPMINEAAYCLADCIVDPAAIDPAMQAAIGFPQGPLDLADTRGLDTLLADLTAWERDLGPRFTPAPLLRAHVAAGALGRKTGRGFLPYA